MTNSGLHSADCYKCGSYQYDRNFCYQLTHDDVQRALLAAWVRERADQGEIPALRSEQAAMALTLKRKPLSSRIELLIIAIASQSDYVGDDISLEYPELPTKTWSISPEDFTGLVSSFIDLGYSGNSDSIGSISLSTKGWVKYEELQRDIGGGAQAFVAMWFADEMRDAYHRAIEKGISNSGWRPLRVDNQDHNGEVNDQIISEIRRSRFLFADFTASAESGQRGNVYFEAGLAQGLGIPVVCSCRKDAVERIQFDLQQRNFILWESENMEDFALRIERRIAATIGRGPVGPNS